MPSASKPAAPAAATPPAPDSAPPPRLTIGSAIAHRIHAGVGKSTGGSSFLDAVAVTGSIVIVAGVLYGLFTVTVPAPQLPVIASVVGLVAGTILGGYAGYRWGASEAMKKAPPENGGAK